MAELPAEAVGETLTFGGNRRFYNQACYPPVARRKNIFEEGSPMDDKTITKTVITDAIYRSLSRGSNSIRTGTRRV